MPDAIKAIVTKLLAEYNLLAYPCWEGVAAHNEAECDKLFAWLKAQLSEK